MLLRPRGEASAPAVARLAARALLASRDRALALPAWLAPHQIPAARRLDEILERYGGALLADAVGLGKSYVALALALARAEPFALVVPAVLAPQWRALLAEHGASAPIVTHERLSTGPVRLTNSGPARLFVVDEAHRFRNPHTNRYRALAKAAVGARVLLITATPVHNRLADLCHLLRLFLRDDALTPLGIPSLNRASHGDAPDALLAGAIARLTVARSRQRVRTYGRAHSLSFPKRTGGRVIRAGVLPDAELEVAVRGIEQLEAGGDAAPLFRLMLLSRLASSVSALRHSLDRYEAYVELALAAQREKRVLQRRDFQRLFPDSEGDALQLVLFPVLLSAGSGVVGPGDLPAIRALGGLVSDAVDPKVRVLGDLLAAGRKTIVFTSALRTARYLARCFARQRVAAVFGTGGLLGDAPANRADVLRAFAPRSQGAPAPTAALETDLLIATDLLSEGVNLQDAERVIHYDLPWSPARLAQRVGRIDRLGSPHDSIDTVTFLPPRPLDRALRMEQRLAAKVRVQITTAVTQIETVRGAAHTEGLDWCDRLDRLCRDGAAAAPGSCAAIIGSGSAVVLIVRLGALVDAIVVDEAGARSDPVGAVDCLEQAIAAPERPVDRDMLERATARAATLVRSRLGTIADARWRAADRDRSGRRLIPWVLAAGRSAARRGDGMALARLDAVVSRLASGMTAGEELLLDELLERPAPLAVADLVAWHDRLAPLSAAVATPSAELVAALAVHSR